MNVLKVDLTDKEESRIPEMLDLAGVLLRLNNETARLNQADDEFRPSLIENNDSLWTTEETSTSNNEHQHGTISDSQLIVSMVAQVKAESLSASSTIHEATPSPAPSNATVLDAVADKIMDEEFSLSSNQCAEQVSNSVSFNKRNDSVASVDYPLNNDIASSNEDVQGEVREASTSKLDEQIVVRTHDKLDEVQLKIRISPRTFTTTVNHHSQRDDISEDSVINMDDIIPDTQLPLLPSSDMPSLALEMDESSIASIQNKLFSLSHVVPGNDDDSTTATDMEDEPPYDSLEERYGGELFLDCNLDQTCHHVLSSDCDNVDIGNDDELYAKLFQTLGLAQNKYLVAKDYLWPLPDFLELASDHMVSSTKLDLDSHDDNGHLESTSHAQRKLNASQLLDELHLSRPSASPVPPPRSSGAAFNQAVVQFPPSEIRKSKLNDMLDELDLSRFELVDRDPATFRSLIRKLSPICDALSLRTLTTAHLLSVCKALVDTPASALQYIAYCQSSPQYIEAMGLEELSALCVTLQSLIQNDDITMEADRSNIAAVSPTTTSAEFIPSTILCQAKQVCEDDVCRRVCLLLESDFQVTILERTHLGQSSTFVTFAFDEASVGVLLSMPNSNQATTSLAKWLVLEAHAFERVAIFCVFNDNPHSIPDAHSRATLRQLASTIALLVRPAPETKLYLARGEPMAARLIRAEMDLRCARGDAEWHRGRDCLKPILSEVEEAQIQLLSAFPRVSALQAESILREFTSPLRFLRAQTNTASFLGRLLKENLAPDTIPSMLPNASLAEEHEDHISHSYSSVPEEYIPPPEVFQMHPEMYQGAKPVVERMQQHQHSVLPHSRSSWGHLYPGGGGSDLQSHLSGTYSPSRRMTKMVSDPLNIDMESNGAMTHPRASPLVMPMHSRSQHPYQTVVDVEGQEELARKGLNDQTPPPTSWSQKKQRRLGLTRSENDKQTRLIWIYSNAPSSSSANLT